MKCKKCGIENDGSFGSGKFCSRKCANSRTWTDEDKLKKSISAKNSEKVKKANNINVILRIGKQSVERIIKHCPICGKEFKRIIVLKNVVIKIQVVIEKEAVEVNQDIIMGFIVVLHMNWFG